MKRLDTLLVVGLAVLILAGMVLAYAPVYRCDLSASVEDGTVRYEYDANYGVEVHTTLIRTEAGYDIQTIVAYYDESYAAKNSWDAQYEFFEDMRKQLEIRSMDDFVYCDSEALVEVMATADPSTTAVFIASGALSEVVYDGTSDSPLISWLERGGTVINIGGVLGKYVSHGLEAEDIETVTGFAALITGNSWATDASFNDFSTPRYADAWHNDEAEEYLGVYLNECTFGVQVDALGKYLSIGNISSYGYSAAVLFESNGGMVINFGMVLSIHPHTGHIVAQAIAAGLDYTAEFVGFQEGNTYGSPSGTFSIDGPGYHIYGYAGSTRAVFAERIMLVWDQL